MRIFCQTLRFWSFCIVFSASILASEPDPLKQQGINVDAETAQKFKDNPANVQEYLNRIHSYGISPAEYLKGKEAGLTVEAIIASRTTTPSPSMSTNPEEFQSLAAGACRIIDRKCVAGPENREFTLQNHSSGRWEGIRIYRDCWQWQYTWECGGYPSRNNCNALRASTCEQMNSRPLKMVEGQAVIWEQKFRCPKGEGKYVRKPVEADSAGIQLPGDKGGLKYPPNKDMSHAMASLAVLKEIQNDLGLNSAQQDNAQAIYGIFRGTQHPCDNHLADFSDCCQKMKGWGTRTGLTKCNAQEYNLAGLREKGLCHEVPGTFCSEKVLGKCIRERKHYCCFPSRLSRIVHEQGRPQIGMGWGDARNPHCQGFLVDQLSRLDFSRMNLSELYADIMASMKDKMEGVVGRNVQERVRHMSSGGKNASQENVY